MSISKENKNEDVIILLFSIFGFRNIIWTHYLSREHQESIYCLEQVCVSIQLKDV